MSKVKKFNIQKCIIFFVVMIIGLFLNVVPAKATTDNSMVTVNLKVTTNGVPLSNAVYSAYNFDTVYQKIIKGDISENDTLSSNWKNLQEQAQPDPTKVKVGVIQFSNGLAVGPGIQHSPEDALSTITYILRMGGLQLLVELNGDKTENILFHQPGRGRLSNNFTDIQGRAVAVVHKGLNAIMTIDGNFQKLVNISKDNQDVGLDSANVDNRLQFSLETTGGVERSNFRKYVVESGQKNPLTFKLKISKDFNRLGGALILTSTPNLIITSVTAPAGVEGVSVDSIVEPGSVGTVNLNQQIKIPSLSEEITLTIKAYVTPTSIKDAPVEGSVLSITGNDDNGTPVCAMSPSVVLAGANFAMVNSKDNKLVQGGEYILGKQLQSGYQIYSAQNGWINVDSLNNIDLSQVTILQGGRQYSIGNPVSIPIPSATNRFNFNATVNNNINQSLIQLIGLVQASNYFLYPVKAPNGEQLKEKMINFSVFAKFKVGKNGSLLTYNSLGDAQEQNFSINITIPDFQTGVNEYNAISVDSGETYKLDIWGKIIFPIALLCILIFSVGLVLAKIV